MASLIWTSAIVQKFRTAYRQYINHTAESPKIELQPLLYHLATFGIADEFMLCLGPDMNNKQIETKISAAWKGSVCELCNTFCRYTEAGKGVGFFCATCRYTPEGIKLRTERGVSNRRDALKRNFADPTFVANRQKKTEETNLRRYGVKYVTQDPTIRYRSTEAQKLFWLSDQAQTAIETRKKTNQGIYGVSNPQQNASVRAKTLSSQSKTKRIVVGTKVFELQGYEPHVIRSLVQEYGEAYVEKNVLTPSDPGYVSIPYGDQRFFPDFYCRPQRKYIEVKSEYTLLDGNWNADAFIQNRKKAKASLEQGLLVLWYVVYPPSLFIRLPKNWFDMSREQLRKYLQSKK